ncbi:hypothetical protein HK097_000553 [Rhizophlyctis rosea]|uniref:F-box domain-containing protein n=1 Tax=Rhizophlyctis rosea TaxID=64517 RepID=A0AAD5X986_9FUNG|nr:hypothetical protein HK097_000553 [Rhizophlyctis rosea]
MHIPVVDATIFLEWSVLYISLFCLGVLVVLAPRWKSSAPPSPSALARGYHRLPPEVVGCILSTFEESDELLALRLVSKTWAQLVRDVAPSVIQVALLDGGVTELTENTQFTKSLVKDFIRRVRSLPLQINHSTVWYDGDGFPSAPDATLRVVVRGAGTIRLAARRVMFGPRARMASKGDQLRTMVSVGGRCLGRFQVEPEDLMDPIWREIGLVEEDRGKKRPLTSYDDEEDPSDEEQESETSTPLPMLNFLTQWRSSNALLPRLPALAEAGPDLLIYPSHPEDPHVRDWSFEEDTYRISGQALEDIRVDRDCTHIMKALQEKKWVEIVHKKVPRMPRSPRTTSKHNLTLGRSKSGLISVRDRTAAGFEEDGWHNLEGDVLLWGVREDLSKEQIRNMENALLEMLDIVGKRWSIWRAKAIPLAE